MTSVLIQPESFLEPIAPAHAGVILIISHQEEHHVLLRSILGLRQWTLHSAQSRREAMALLRRLRAHAIICDCDLIDGGWNDVLQDPVRLRSCAPVIVISRCADEHLWLDVMDSGGHDVLVKPFEAAEVIRMVRSACRAASQPQPRLMARRALR